MKVNPTRIVVSVVVAVFCLLAQVGCAAVDMGAEHVAPAPESVTGKTLQFFCEKEAVAGAMPTRDENTYMFLPPGGEGGYVVTWHKKNEETSMSATPEGEKILTAATYTRTGKNTATVVYTFEFSHGEGNISRWYTRTFELIFTSPTGGKATCTVTGKPTTIWAEKITYTGSFSLE